MYDQNTSLAEYGALIDGRHAEGRTLGTINVAAQVACTKAMAPQVVVQHIGRRGVMKTLLVLTPEDAIKIATDMIYVATQARIDRSNKP